MLVQSPICGCREQDLRLRVKVGCVDKCFRPELIQYLIIMIDVGLLNCPLPVFWCEIWFCKLQIVQVVIVSDRVWKTTCRWFDNYCIALLPRQHCPHLTAEILQLHIPVARFMFIGVSNFQARPLSHCIGVEHITLSWVYFTSSAQESSCIPFINLPIESDF